MKGGGKAVLQKLETNFSQLGDKLWAELTDLSLSSSALQSSWNKLIQARTAIAKQHDLDWATHETVKGAAVAGAESTVEDWKSLLCQSYGKQLKITPSKDQLLYNTTMADEGFEATCLCVWSGNTYSGEPAVSKRNAEHLAAKAALQAEFPACFQAAMGQMRSTAGAKGGAPPMAGKRKHDAVDSNNNAATNPKQMLNMKMMIVKTEMGLDKIASGDITTESIALDGGKFVSEVTIGFLETRNRHKGKPQDSKKAAEKSACEVALKALAGIINKYEAPFNERKKLKNAEALAKLKENLKAKKANA